MNSMLSHSIVDNKVLGQQPAYPFRQMLVEFYG